MCISFLLPSPLRMHRLRQTSGVLLASLLFAATNAFASVYTSVDQSTLTLPPSAALDRSYALGWDGAQYIAVGNYQAATQVALGVGEDDATPAFDKLDEALTKGIEQSRSQLRNDIVNARRVLSGATAGAALLSFAAAVAVALGIWPRLSEYR